MKFRWIIISLFLIIISFIYWLLDPKKREWVKDYLIPVIFFFWIGGETIWQTIKLFRIKFMTISNLALRSANNILVTLFISLAIISYLIRQKPIHKAIGIKERVFPLFVLMSQLFGFRLIVRHTKFRFNPVLYVLGFILSISGIVLSCLALWELKRSFSIMVEVRKIITKGVYSKIRHPLYAGELTYVLGLAMLFNNIVSYSMFLLLLVFQSIRAILEEIKLTTYVPEYAAYKARTGFYFPKLR